MFEGLIAKLIPHKIFDKLHQYQYFRGKYLITIFMSKLENSTWWNMNKTVQYCNKHMASFRRVAVKYGKMLCWQPLKTNIPPSTTRFLLYLVPLAVCAAF